MPPLLLVAVVDTEIEETVDESVESRTEAVMNLRVLLEDVEADLLLLWEAKLGQLVTVTVSERQQSWVEDGLSSQGHPWAFTFRSPESPSLCALLSFLR